MRASQIAASLLLLPLLALVTGCPKKGSGDADAAAEAGAVAVVDAGPETTNAAQITHYPDEAMVDRISATVKVTTTSALTAVPKGTVIAALKKGDTVTQVSEHNGYFLVVFSDPKDATKKLQGWVVKFAFDEPVAVPKKKPKVPDCGSMSNVFLVTKALSPFVPHCAPACTEDSDCASKSCISVVRLQPDGSTVEGQMGFAQVCDEPAPGAAAVDAGAKPAAVTTCPKGKTLMSLDSGKTSFCTDAKMCSSDKDCTAGQKCTEGKVMDAKQPNGQPMPVSMEFCYKQ